MTAKKFNLSDKIKLLEFDTNEAVVIDDIKEFIKLLKEELEDMQLNDSINDKRYTKIVDKLAGDRLK